VVGVGVEVGVGVGDDVGVLTIQPAIDSDATITSTTIAATFLIIR
jgi:hypothetical protein